MNFNESNMTDQISNKKYNLTIGAVLLWGFAMNVLFCNFLTDYFATFNFALIIVGYFVLCISGILICKKSSNPLISFVGYNLIVLPVGVVLSLVLKEYDSVSILNTFILTTIITIVLIIASTIKPQIFLSLGKVLPFTLITVIIVELVFLFTGFYTPTFWDFVVAVLFCGYIGYDWAKAQANVKTIDNAIDSACELYLDIINLFIRLLKKK